MYIIFYIRRDRLGNIAQISTKRWRIYMKSRMKHVRQKTFPLYNFHLFHQTLISVYMVFKVDRLKINSFVTIFDEYKIVSISILTTLSNIQIFTLAIYYPSISLFPFPTFYYNCASKLIEVLNISHLIND